MSSTRRCESLDPRARGSRACCTRAASPGLKAPSSRHAAKVGLGGGLGRSAVCFVRSAASAATWSARSNRIACGLSCCSISCGSSDTRPAPKYIQAKKPMLASRSRKDTAFTISRESFHRVLGNSDKAFQHQIIHEPHGNAEVPGNPASGSPREHACCAMLHRRESALYRPGLREQAAGFDGIRSIAGFGGKTPSCERKSCGVASKRALHELKARKNRAADESAVASQEIHRGRSAGGDHEARPAENRPGSNQRRPAVGPELVRLPIAVRHPALVPLRLYPGGDHGSSSENGLQPLARGRSRDVRDDDLVGRESLPALLQAS